MTLKIIDSEKHTVERALQRESEIISIMNIKVELIKQNILGVENWELELRSKKIDAVIYSLQDILTCFYHAYSRYIEIINNELNIGAYLEEDYKFRISLCSLNQKIELTGVAAINLNDAIICVCSRFYSNMIENTLKDTNRIKVNN